ncbi:MAG: helix-turn-helix transcriptional regulator [Myxococcaceae bacterium]|nr:MAG: helix-turn-helix transcriptional regulator [Myxococcaceae bacterium]
MNFNSHQLMLEKRVILALNSSLFLPQALEAAREPLLELAEADHMAMCLMRFTPTLSFQWLVPGPRIALFDEYAGLARYDFLRKPIIDRPGVVVRHEELLPRKEFEANLLYQRSRELDLPLEQVMAVLLTIGPDFYAAFALYRTRRRAFPASTHAALSSLTEHLTQAVRNCHAFQSVAAGAQALEALYDRADTALLVVEPPSKEVMRSPRAAALLERWFTPSEFDTCGLPHPLKERLDALVRMDAGARLQREVWTTLHGDAYRLVRFMELPAREGPRQWVLQMNEIPRSIPLPADMKSRLTPRQTQIATYLLGNWDLARIASELARSPHTVKTQMKEVYFRLGVDGQQDLIYQAARLNRPV